LTNLFIYLFIIYLEVRSVHQLLLLPTVRL